MKYIQTFTIFGGDMRYIWIGPIYIIVEGRKVSFHWDDEIAEGMKYRWTEFWKR